MPEQVVDQRTEQARVAAGQELPSAMYWFAISCIRSDVDLAIASVPHALAGSGCPQPSVNTASVTTLRTLTKKLR